MPEFSSNRPDLLAQLERYGSVLEDAARTATGADGLSPSGGARPVPLILPLPARPTRPWRRVVLSAAVVVLVLAGALALTRGRGDVNSGPIDAGRASTVDPSGPATSPRLVAGRLPAGLVPTAALEGRNAPGLILPPGSFGRMNNSPSAPAPQATLQVFDVKAGEAPVTTIVVIIDGTDEPAFAPHDDVEVRGVRGGPTSGSGVHGLNWAPDRAEIYAQTADALPPADLRAIVEALRARGGDPMTGFDPPAAPVGAWTVALRAEHVVARGTPAPPVSRVWYGDAAKTDRLAVVEAYGPVAGASADLLGARQASERRVIAGAERLVSPASAGVPWTMVTWLRPDGVQAVVQAKGLTDAEIEALVGGVGAADPAVWDHLRAAIGDTLRTGTPVVSGDLPIGRVEAYGDDVDSGMPRPRLRGACLTVTGATPRCSAIAPMAGAGGTEAYGAGGSLEAGLPDAGQYIASLVVDGHWYAIGAMRGIGPVTLTAGGSSVATATTRANGDVVVFGAEVPGSADRAELVIPPDGRSGGQSLTVTLVRP